jgi:PTS system ascorbate-specific IIA component
MFFFLVCHNPLGKALSEAIQHSFDHKINELIVIDVLPTQVPEEVANVLHREWTKKNCPTSIIVLTDIIGASPSNGLHIWLARNLVDYKGIAGINVPILLSALSHKNDGIETVFNRIKKAASSGLRELKKT